MAARHARPRTVKLREAASTIFALVALLPLLILVFLLYRFDGFGDMTAQVLLFLALVLAILGFVLLQQMLGRVARLARSVEQPGERTPAGDALSGAVSGLGDVAEIGQLGQSLSRMLSDLRTSTERLEDLVFKLGALSEMVELAARVPQIGELLTLVLDRTMRTVRASTGSIMLVDPDCGALRVVAERGGAGGSDRVYALGEGIPGTVAARGETIVVDDASQDSRLAGEPRHARGSFVCVPVRVEERIIGVVNLGKPVPAGGFTATDLQFLQTLMSHIAYSLDNARLLEETRQTALRLEQALASLQAAQTALVEGETLRAMGQMASGMAHHLNNLLTVVSGRVQLILMQQMDGTHLQRSLETARQATDEAADVVRRVLEFTSRQPLSSASATTLGHLVREVIEVTRPRWHDEARLAGVSIDVVLDLTEVPAVAGETTGLREVVTNLVLNALDAMPRGGRLTIRTWTRDGHVFCSIADTGVGMSEEVRHRALEPFFTTKGPQGVGLGLSVAHAVLERHRGDLAIASAPGQGTTVTFRLPAAPAGAATPPVREAVPVTPRRILIVDDEREVREALADSLAAHGHAVVQAECAREVLERLAADADVDLVLTDLGMPDMSGWDLARAVKAGWPRLRVGIITGWGIRAPGTPEQRQAVDFVIAKPFSIEGLLGAIAEAVATPAAVGREAEGSRGVPDGGVASPSRQSPR